MPTYATRPPASRRSLVAVLLTVAALAGCANHVTVQGGWEKDAAQAHTYSRILVVGLSPDYNQRCAFEWSMAASLKTDHTDALPSCNMIKSADPLNRESVERAVASSGADAVLTTVLVAQESRSKEGGESDTRGSGAYKATDAGFVYDYYGAYGMPVVYGQYVTTQTITTVSSKVHVASRLYDAHGGAPVYRMEIRAGDLHARDSGLATITPAIAGRLKRDGLIQ